MDSEIDYLEQISDYFSTLSEQAERLAFPDLRTGIFELKDVTKWKVIPKYIYNASHPLVSKELTNIFFLIFWLVIYLVAYLSLVIGLAVLFPVVQKSPPLIPPTDVSGWVISVVGLIIGLLVSMVAYFWWFDTFSNNKNPWLLKIVLLGVSILFVYLLIRELMTQFQAVALWNSSGDTFSILLSILLLLFPGISYFIAVIFDIILNILLAIKTVFGGVKAVLQPRPIQIIKQLATEGIQSNQPGNVPWKLSDLHKTEVSVLRQWAEANREGSEKRTIPVFLIAALIGVFFSSDFLRNIIDTLLFTLYTNLKTYLHAKSIFTLPMEVSISALVIIPFFLAMIIIVMNHLIELFRNIVAQNLIVEACIISEYALEKQEQINSQRNREVQNNNDNWFRRILNYLKF